MGLISTIVVGLLAGWLASLIMKAKGGLFIHLVLGVVGSILGGWITSLILGENLVSGFNLTSILVSIVGAVLVIAIYRLFKKKA
jgi:uncharacterized membrane protein YeaQ/YmgE (transglycosylase-associated protein family)